MLYRLLIVIQIVIGVYKHVVDLSILNIPHTIRTIYILEGDKYFKVTSVNIYRDHDQHHLYLKGDKYFKVTFL